MILKKTESIIIRTLLVIGFLNSSTTADENQWSTNGPIGGTIIAIAVNPFDHESIYTGTIQNGFYHSVNAGANWTHVDSDILPITARAIAFHPLVPDTIYVTALGGIFKSPDGGNSWIKLHPPHDSDGEYRALLVHPTEPNRIIAGGPMTSWMSLDGGSNWINVDTSPNIGISSLACDPNNQDIIYLVASGMIFGLGVWKSYDRGETWINIQNNIDTTGYGTDIEVDPVNSDILYLSQINVFDTIDDDCLYKSIDGGDSWVDITPEGLTTPIVQAVKISSLDHNIVFICTTDDGVLKSTDGGENWQFVNSGLYSPRIVTMEVDWVNDIIYIGTYYHGIYKSIDQGESWQKISSNIYCLDCFDIAVNFEEDNVCVVASVIGAQRSSDYGQNWTNLDVGFTWVHQPLSVEYEKGFPDNIYLSTGPTAYPPQLASGFYRSTDGGESWAFFNNGLPTNQSYVDIAISSYNGEARRFFLASSQGLYRSNDLAESWVLCDAGIPTDIRYTIVEVAPSDPNVIAVGDEIDRVYISLDQGESWNQAGRLPEHPRSEYIKDIEFDPNGAYHIFISSYFQGLFESFDGGTTWNNINNNLPLDPTIAVVSGITINPYNPLNIFVASNHRGVFQTRDGGQYWESFNTGLDTTDGVGDMMFVPGDTTKLFFASSRRSAWSITRTATSIADDDALLPTQFAAHNYPNPFNAATNISFSLPRAADVRLDIYDMLGRKVSSLVNEYMFTGYHTVVWKPDGLGSGMYFYIITTGDYDACDKVMLLK